MNEHEFRESLRASMSVNPEPPPMGDGPVLDAARRDRKRRRAMWAGAGSAAAVVAIAIGVVVVAPSSGGDGGVAVGDAPPTVQTTDASDPSDKQTETSWPNGQTDRTQTSGPEAEKGVTLLNELEAVVPDGYETPDDLVGNGELAGAPMRTHQAQYQDTVDDVEVWDYMADVGVTKGDSVGRLLAQVITPGAHAGEGCELAQVAWGVDGKCTEIVVGGKRVGVKTDPAPSAEAGQFEQWAVCRHDDGTVVSVAQSTFRAFTDFPPLKGPMFTADQLAELAADDRFHLD